MKVLICNPAGKPSKYKRHRLINYTAIPLGLAYIAGVLEKGGHKVRVLDAAVFELTQDQVRNIFKRYSPDVIAFQAFTPLFNYSAQYAKIAKEVLPDVKIIIGGHHVTFLPEQSMQLSPETDFIVRGEGENTVSNLVNALEENEPNLKEITGISYRENGIIKHNKDTPLIENLDDIPWPARHLFPNNQYHFFGSNMKGTSMVSSRGCNQLCQFCSITKFYKHRWRKRSAKDVVEEMKYINDKYKATIIGFMDDCFALDKKRVYDICNEMHAHGLVGKVCWGSALRVETVNYDILRKMRKAGCAMLFFGVESGDQAILDNVHKGITTSKVEAVFKHAKKLGLNTIASLAFGFPGDTFKNCLKTIEWVRTKLRPSFVVWAAATPYPGTPFFDEALEKGWIKEIPTDWSEYTMMDPVLELSELSKEDVKNLIKYAYKSMHFNPRYLLGRAIYEIRQGIELYGTLQIFRQFIESVLPWLNHIRKYGVYSQLLPKDPEDWK
ncbi:MAG: B12-binding domain-containing radical SAM protein [Candidatus Helarchaeota archaeon]